MQQTSSRPLFVMESVEDRTLMSSVVFSQCPALVMPMTQTPRQAPAQGPAAGPSAAPRLSRIPVAPTGVTATPISADSIEVKWNAVQKNADTIVVDYSTDGVHFATLAMLDRKATSFVASGLESGKTYSFKLWAMNGKGSSPASEIVATVLG